MKLAALAAGLLLGAGCTVRTVTVAPPPTTRPATTVVVPTTTTPAPTVSPDATVLYQELLVQEDPSYFNSDTAASALGLGYAICRLFDRLGVDGAQTYLQSHPGEVGPAHLGDMTAGAVSFLCPQYATGAKAWLATH